MNIGLFIPCFMDTFFPDAAMATLEVLERLGAEVDYPQAQTCCGQPMSNSGCRNDARATAAHFISTFSSYDYVVSPSGSCVSMVRNHYSGLTPDEEACRQVSSRTYELCEFLTDIMQVDTLDVSFPYKVGFHSACHGLRELRLGESSERQKPAFSKPLALLGLVKDLELIQLSRPDECCGFGGTFAVAEESVSCAMGKDRIRDHREHGVDVIVSTDSSCLMHLDGLMRREGDALQVLHIAQVLNGARL